MQKIYLFVLLCCISLPSFSKIIRFSGTVSGIKTGTAVYLFSQETGIISDSVVARNSGFEFNVDVQKHGLYFIKCMLKNRSLSFASYLANDDLHVQIGDDFSTVKYSGSQLAYDQTDFFDGYLKIMRESKHRLKKTEGRMDSADIDFNRRIAEQNGRDAEQYCATWIRKHPSSAYSLAVLYLEMQQADPNLQTELYKLIADSAKSNNYVNEIIWQMIADNKARRQFSIGSVMNDFELNDQYGSPYRYTASNSNKIIIIDFWASWCAPCRANTPILKDIVARYGNDKVMLVGISADHDKAAWLKAIDEDKMNWLQLSDLKGTSGGFVEEKAISAFPTYIVIDQKGKIVSLPQTAERLMVLVKTLIK